jgi:TfoX/Sxy family transcriptional regulator of competence genes
VPRFEKTLRVTASPERAWEVIGDLTLMGGLAGATEVKVEEMTRVCTFPNRAVQHERISNYSPDQRSYSYAINDGPLPVKNSEGRLAVQTAGDDSAIVWGSGVRAHGSVPGAGDERDVGRRDGPGPCGCQGADRERGRTAMKAETLFDELSRTFLGSPNVTTARMFGSSALKVKNKVFACFYKGKLVLKLPRERVDDLVASGGAVHFDSGTGRPAKEWVAIDSSRGGEWLGLAKDAKNFVASSR